MLSTWVFSACRIHAPAPLHPFLPMQARLAGATNLTEALHAAEALDRAGAAAHCCQGGVMLTTCRRQEGVVHIIGL